MRDYARISPGFWVSPEGRKIRRLGQGSFLLALYLQSCPASNMIGLYYLPLPTLCHETGLSEKEALKALRSLSEAQFAAYDLTSETAWVFDMAKSQIAAELNPNDKQCKGVWRELSRYKHTKFFKGFYELYRTTFHLPPTDFLASSESSFQGPSRPLRSQDQAPVQAQEEAQAQEQKLNGQVKTLAVLPKSHMTWKAYSGEYRRRYGVEPVRNAKSNAQLCQLVDRLGAEEAPRVAAFYVSHNKQIYTSNRHPVSLLLRDAESIRTDFLTGHPGSSEKTAPKSVAEWCVRQNGVI